MSPQKNPATERIGGPGAAHENRKEPEKSRPHGELPHDDAGSGNAATRIQNKILDKVPGARTDAFAGHPGAGGDHRPHHLTEESRGHHHTGDTGKDDDPVKPTDRRQVR